MPDESKSNASMSVGWFLVFCIAAVIIGVFWFNFNEPNKINFGEVVTIGDESFIYVQAEKLTDRRGVIATLEAISRFRNEHPDLCVIPWHHEMVGEPGQDTQSHGIWIHHRQNPPGGC